MALRLNVGVSKKLGLPEYSSVGASCNLEVELDPGLLHSDPEGLRERVRLAFLACQRAVDAELARHDGSTTRPATPPGKPLRATRPATPSQRRALRAIAHRQGIDLADFLRDHAHFGGEDALSIIDASRLIDALKVVHSGAG